MVFGEICNFGQAVLQDILNFCFTLSASIFELIMFLSWKDPFMLEVTLVHHVELIGRLVLSVNYLLALKLPIGEHLQ